MADRIEDLVGTSLIALGVGSALGSESDPEARREATSPEGPDREPSACDDDAGIGQRVDAWQKRHRAIAFGYAVVKKYGEDGGGRLAATVSYFAFFSVFPALLALVAVAGFVLENNPDLRADVVGTAVGQFPVIGKSIADASLAGSGAAVVIGLGGALWAGLGSMLAAQHAFNTVWDVPWHRRPGPVRARLRGLLMFLVIAVGLLAATVLTNLVTELGVPIIARIAIAGANIAVNVGLAYLAFQILTARHLDWGALRPGAVVAGTVFYGLQTVGSFIVSRYVTNAGDTYGTFALVIGLLAWFHLATQATLLAAEINVVRQRKLWPRTLFGASLTDGDRRALAGFQRAAARDERAEPAHPALGPDAGGAETSGVSPDGAGRARLGRRG